MKNKILIGILISGCLFLFIEGLYWKNISAEEYHQGYVAASLDKLDTDECRAWCQ